MLFKMHKNKSLICATFLLNTIAFYLILCYTIITVRENKQMLIEEFGNDEETIRNACMLYAGLKQGFLNSMK